MSKTDIRLLYQKDTGLCFDTINQISENPSHQYGTRDENTVGYIEWLEEQLESSLSIGEVLLWKVKESIFWKERNKSKNETSEPGAN